MATRSFTRLLSKPKTATSFCRRFPSSAARAAATSSPASSSDTALSRLLLLGSIRRVSSAVPSFELRRLSFRSLSTDVEPSAAENEPPKEGEVKKEEILLDGCDFLHWFVIMEKPEGDPTREEIIDSYIKTLAAVVGSEEEAKKRIYSVSTRCYYGFNFEGEKELTENMHDLPNVRFVVPDSYLDVKNKDYGGEPFIDGKAVPYDPKYHKDWLRNKSQANNAQSKGPRRNDDRSGNRPQYNRRGAEGSGNA